MQYVKHLCRVLRSPKCAFLLQTGRSDSLPPTYFSPHKAQLLGHGPWAVITARSLCWALLCSGAEWNRFVSPATDRKQLLCLSWLPAPPLNHTQVLCCPELLSAEHPSASGAFTLWGAAACPFLPAGLREWGSHPHLGLRGWRCKYLPQLGSEWAAKQRLTVTSTCGYSSSLWPPVLLPPLLVNL